MVEFSVGGNMRAFNKTMALNDGDISGIRPEPRRHQVRRLVRLGYSKELANALYDKNIKAAELRINTKKNTFENNNGN